MDSIFTVLRRLEKRSQLEKSRKINVLPEDRMLAITKETGELINMLLHMKKVKNMLEIGMSVGYSTIWCAEAIQQQSGKIITIEQNPKKIKKAQKNFQNAQITDTVLIKEGNAMQILTELKSDKKYKNFFDFVLIDADKENIIEYFNLILPMVSVDGVIITDNMLYPEKYTQEMKKLSKHIKKNPKLKTITLPIGNGEEITLKIK